MKEKIEEILNNIDDEEILNAIYRMIKIILRY